METPKEKSILYRSSIFPSRSHLFIALITIPNTPTIKAKDIPITPAHNATPNRHPINLCANSGRSLIEKKFSQSGLNKATA